MNIKQIAISLIDRLAAYAAREAENEDPEETKRQEEAAAKRLAERVRSQKQRAKENGTSMMSPTSDGEHDWNTIPPVSTVVDENPANGDAEKTNGAPKRFRGIPENVKLFEVFWHQVVELIKVHVWTFRTRTFHSCATLLGKTGLVNTGHDCAARVSDEPLAQLLS